MQDFDITKLPTWVAAIMIIGAGIASYYLKPFLEYLKNRKDKEADIQIAQNQQALVIYQDLVKGLRDDIERLEKYLHESEQEKIKYLHENIKLTERVRTLEFEIDDLKKRVGC